MLPTPGPALHHPPMSPRPLVYTRTLPGGGFVAIDAESAIVGTGASDHHFLAPEKVRGILGGFFAAPLVSPGLYLPSAAFAEGGTALLDEPQQRAELHGRALVELATAVGSSRWLRTMRPPI